MSVRTLWIRGPTVEKWIMLQQWFEVFESFYLL